MSLSLWILLFAGIFPGVSGELKGQNPELDSLRQLLSQEERPQERAIILNKLSEKLFEQSPEEAFSQAREALSLSRSEKLALQEGKALRNFGRIYGSRYVYDSSRIYYEQALVIAEAIPDSHLTGSIYNDLGRLGYRRNNFKEAQKSFSQSLEIFTSLRDTLAMAQCLTNLGAVNRILGNYDHTLDYYLQSLSIYESLGEHAQISRVNFNLGILYMVLQEYEKAGPYFEESLTEAQASGNRSRQGRCYKAMGDLNWYLEDYKGAIIEYDKAMVIAQELGDKALLSQLFNSVGITRAQLGDYAKAIEDFKWSNELKEELEDTGGQARTYINMGDVYYNLKSYKQSLQAFEKGLELAIKTDTRDTRRDAYGGMAKAQNGLGRFEEAYQNQLLYNQLKDSILDATKNQQLAELQARYDQEKSEAEIIRLEAENIKQDLRLERQGRVQAMLIGGSILILFMAIGGYLFYRNRQQKKALLLEKQQADKLRRIDELKDQFLANTSHELRTPLNGIIGLAESLHDGVAGPLPEKANKSLSMIMSSGRRLNSLVNDILDFSRLKNQELMLHKKAVDLYSAVDVVLSLSEPLAIPKKLSLINQVSRDLVAAHADEDRLQQILHNLIGNAIKFTHQGSVTVKAVQKGEMLAIQVQDTGIGIAPDKLEAIFQAFEQGDGSVAREYGGTGLGLTVSQDLVNLHGGEIKVESQQGKGTLFTFTLPVSKDQPAQEAPPLPDRVRVVSPEEETTSGLPQAHSKGISILVVDDEPVNLQVLDNHLSLAGYKVTQAPNGMEALTLMKDSPFDLIILDIMMPKMSGYEVCRRLREMYLPSEMPVVMLTAKDRVPDLLEGFDAGANDYLVKPFSKDELLSRIKTHLNLHRIHQATGKFVPYEFLRAIGRETITEVQLGDQAQKEVTVLFSDIRDYTRISEEMSPEENFSFVNAFNGRMGPIIQDNGGFVNQYIGDGIMAIFPSEASGALQAAIHMQQSVYAYNKDRFKTQRLPIKIGIGLHSGHLIMGIIGDENRMDAATIADTVNSASRIESLTKHYQTKVLVSQALLDHLPSDHPFTFRFLGKVQVKGKSKALGIYECLEADPPNIRDQKMVSLDQFQQGIHHFFQKEFAEAAFAFEQVSKSCPDDGPARLFLKRSAYHLTHPVDTDWNGLEEMGTK